MRNPAYRPHRQHGFTLVEAVAVIIITGIIASVVAVFIRSPVEGYVDTVRRAELTDAADTALRRIARDARTALPNSLRDPDPTSDQCFEFLPVVAGGRYRVNKRPDGTGDELEFNVADSTFDVLGQDGLPQATGAQAVIYNLGIPGADAYAGDNRAAISASTATSITLSAGMQFPLESPGRRVQVTSASAVAYACIGTGTVSGNGTGTLYRYTQAISSSRMAGCPGTAPAGAAILASHVSGCSLKYTSAVSQRNGLLSLTLVLTREGESARLYHEVHVDNTP